MSAVVRTPSSPGYIQVEKHGIRLCGLWTEPQSHWRPRPPLRTPRDRTAAWPTCRERAYGHQRPVIALAMFARRVASTLQLIEQRRADRSRTDYATNRRRSRAAMMDTPLRTNVCDAGKIPSRRRCGARSLHILMRRPIGQDGVGGPRARERRSPRAGPPEEAGRMNVPRTCRHNKRATAHHSR